MRVCVHVYACALCAYVCVYACACMCMHVCCVYVCVCMHVRCVCVSDFSGATTKVTTHNNVTENLVTCQAHAVT